ncbi:unnamed protein product [Orchesella dallaii]|uniref:PDZ domain-containing protein n=1 Tax=Orchesella dallaii TaxID=48710 RepID=A0ABP1R664_9HEXA
MDNIVTTVLYHDDFIFVHRKGSKKEIKLTKSEDVFGFTLADNGNGYTIVKQIKDGSIIDSCKAINVGDHIEQIDNDNMVGLTHQEVSNYLKSITIGKQIVMYLVEPRKILEDMFKIAIKSIGKLLKNDMGISDIAVAHKLFEMALGKSNTMELAAAIDSSDLTQLGITDDFLIEIWGIVTDAKAGRLIDQGNDASD